MLAESTDQPHLIDALHRICAALGGLTRTWRFDRMATVCHPGTGQVTASFAAVAKHYGVSVAICPPRRGNRKGVVEKANHTAAQRWWRTLADDVLARAGPGRLDRWCALRGDTRHAPHRRRQGHRGHRRRAPSRLAALPAPFPAVLAVQRVASAQALVAFRGNHYSVPPELARAQITVSHRLGAPRIELATSGGIVIARHQLAPAGAGATVRDTGHVLALERAALAAFTDAAPHRRKQRIPPGPAARAAAAALRARPRPDTHHRTRCRPDRCRAKPRSASTSWSTSPATPPPPREGTPCDDHSDRPLRRPARPAPTAPSRLRAPPRRPASTSSCAATWPR